MKKITLIVSLIVLLIVSGCIHIFILPNDTEFLALIERLNTPRRICQYMLDNFETEDHPYITLTPYQLYITKKGDCDDFTAFAQFIANWHGYETYKIRMLFAEWVYGYFVYHVIPVFVENSHYTFAENQYYFGQRCNSFKEIMEKYNGWISYTVYDYEMNIIEIEYNEI